MGILLTVANRKGGVGKSTITTMLAHGFAVTGEQRVLVVDLDTQCNSSIILTGGEKWEWARRNRMTVADYFNDKYDRPRLRPDDYILRQVGDIEAPLGELSVLSGSLDLKTSRMSSCTIAPARARICTPPSKASPEASRT